MSTAEEPARGGASEGTPSSSSGPPSAGAEPRAAGSPAADAAAPGGLDALCVALSSALGTWEVCRAVAARALPALAADAALLLAPARDALPPVFAQCETPGEVVALQRGAPAGGTLAEVVRTGVPVWLDRAEELSDGAEPPGAPGGARAILPLAGMGGSVRGALAFAWAAPGPLAPERRELALAVAGEIARALERARRYDAERSERLRAQAGLEEARRLAEVQDQLVGVVAHDLRSPLQTVIMGARLIQQRGALEPVQSHTLARMVASAERAAAMIRDLLDLARVRQGLGMRIAPQDADLGAVCARAVAELQGANPGRLVGRAVYGDVHGRFDPERLSQVVVNLASNALHHGGAAARVAVVAEGRPDELTLAVWNDGPAIPPGRLERLFEPRTAGGGGTPVVVGLGLFIVREIVRAHGGRLAVRSSPEDGTTFEVVLPRRAVA